jgi:hypothetical protein
MPSYGSLGSPGVQKMENYNSRYGGGKKGFSLGHIFGDPFPLATIGIATVRNYCRGFARVKAADRIRRLAG